MAPHNLKKLNCNAFMDWLETKGASLCEPTNPYEVIRYRLWTDADAKRPSTHIIYRRRNDTLTYTEMSRQHYEQFMAEFKA